MASQFGELILPGEETSLTPSHGIRSAVTSIGKPSEGLSKQPLENGIVDRFDTFLSKDKEFAVVQIILEDKNPKTLKNKRSIRIHALPVRLEVL
jgi:hypothetical protein